MLKISYCHSQFRFVLPVLLSPSLADFGGRSNFFSFSMTSFTKKQLWKCYLKIWVSLCDVTKKEDFFKILRNLVRNRNLKKLLFYNNQNFSSRILESETRLKVSTSNEFEKKIDFMFFLNISNDCVLLNFQLILKSFLDVYFHYSIRKLNSIMKVVC